MCLNQDDTPANFSPDNFKAPSWVFIPGVGTIDTSATQTEEEFHNVIQWAIDGVRRAAANDE